MAKKIYYLKFLLLFIVLLNYQYSTSQTSRMSRGKLTFIPHKTDKGLIFGSVTFPNKKALYNSYIFILKSKDPDKKISRKNTSSFSIHPKQLFKVEHGGELDEGLTYLFAIQLPDGEYELSRILLNINGGILGTSHNLYDPLFKIQIKSVKGEINYAGNIALDEYTLKKLNNVNEEDVIKHYDNFEKDIEAIKKEQVYIYWEAAKNNLSNQAAEILSQE